MKHEIVLKRTQKPLNAVSTVRTQAGCQAHNNLGIVDDFGRVLRPNFAFPELKLLCKGGAITENHTSVQVLSFRYREEDSFDGMVWCGERIASSGGTFRFSPLTCINGIPAVQLTQYKAPDQGRGLADLSIQISGTAEMHEVASDNWYPEDCVARAQRGH